MSAKATPDDVEPTTEADTRLGADVSFPFDRMTVEQFRKRFPRARWSEARQAWFVPGPTASRRFTGWLAELEAEADAFADAKGRDAFEFDPIASVYLELGRAGFRISTPYSRTVVEKLREIPYSRWDSDLKLWHVPFRSYRELKDRWPEIAEAARRNEPEERRRCAEERKGTEQEAKSKARTTERKRRRYPLNSDKLPPLGRVVVIQYGLVVFEEITGELVEPEVVGEFYPGATDGHVWGTWRKPTFEELVQAWPLKTPVADGAEWWQPTIQELRPAGGKPEAGGSVIAMMRSGGRCHALLPEALKVTGKRTPVRYLVLLVFRHLWKLLTSDESFFKLLRRIRGTLPSRYPVMRAGEVHALACRADPVCPHNGS